MPTNLTKDNDLFAAGITAWAELVRIGKLSFQETVEICLARIEDSAYLEAFEVIDSNRAMASAKAMDQLLASGTDLGPLMGLPIGVKDIMAVEGLPTTNGSNADTAHLTGSEGSVVKALKAAGAIVMGKTKTVEFAFGSTGVNEPRGTPWNPADRTTKRIPGGSSSGSAVAVAAGLIGMGLGTDTGGSVRIPACLTGIFGHKTSVGLWPTDGIFSLSTTLDSVGPLVRTVNDAALFHTLMSGESVGVKQSVKGLKFGVPHTLFLDDLDTSVAEDFERCCNALVAAGAIRYDIDFPEAIERAYLVPDIVSAELITTLSPELFVASQDDMDTVSADRSSHGLQVSAVEYIAAQRRRKHLAAKAHATFTELDCWLSPTVPFEAIALADIESGKLHERALEASRNTQPGNLFEFCATSMPMQKEGLPTGLQVMMPLHADARLLATSQAIQKVINDS